jgi:hypothetical protein
VCCVGGMSGQQAGGRQKAHFQDSGEPPIQHSANIVPRCTSGSRGQYFIQCALHTGSWHMHGLYALGQLLVQHHMDPKMKYMHCNQCTAIATRYCCWFCNLARPSLTPKGCNIALRPWLLTVSAERLPASVSAPDKLSVGTPLLIALH